MTLETNKLPTPPRCSCGAMGTWCNPQPGAHGGQRAWWAGCPACRGRALGTPVLDRAAVWSSDRTAIVAVR